MIRKILSPLMLSAPLLVLATTSVSAQTSGSSSGMRRDSSAMSRPGSMHGDSAQGVVNLLAVANRDEIEAGKLAASKAMRSDVKAYAQKLVDEHTKALKQLDDSAMSGGWMKTDSMSGGMEKADSMAGGGDAQKIHAANAAAMQKLKSATGASFDETYLSTQADGHKMLLTTLEKYSPSNAKLKTIVADTKMSVQQHLDEAKRLQSGTGATRPK